MKGCAGILMIALVASVSARTLQAPATKRNLYRPAPMPPLHEERVKGVIPRALRGGDALQVLNPNAPARYGTAERCVILEPDSGKWKGIKLFESVF